MLVLSRRIGENLLIGDDIEVFILGFDRGQVKIGVKAPRNVPVDRSEVRDRKESEGNRREDPRHKV